MDPSSHWERGGITGRSYALNLQGSKCRHDNAARMLGETPSSEGEGAETAAVEIHNTWGAKVDSEVGGAILICVERPAQARSPE